MSRLIYSLSPVSYAVYAILGRRRQHRLEGRQQYLVLVICNLLSDAMKFSNPNGLLQVALSVEDEGHHFDI
jgi:hypothetical protein